MTFEFSSAVVGSLLFGEAGPLASIELFASEQLSTITESRLVMIYDIR
jgi:hypothetical protein